MAFSVHRIKLDFWKTNKTKYKNHSSCFARIREWHNRLMEDRNWLA